MKTRVRELRRERGTPGESAVKRAAKLVSENFRAVGQSEEENPVLVYREFFPGPELFQRAGDQAGSHSADFRRELLRMLCEERAKRLLGMIHQCKV